MVGGWKKVDDWVGFGGGGVRNITSGEQILNALVFVHWYIFSFILFFCFYSDNLAEIIALLS